MYCPDDSVYIFDQFKMFTDGRKLDCTASKTRKNTAVNIWYTWQYPFLFFVVSTLTTRKKASESTLYLHCIMHAAFFDVYL